MHDPLWEDKNIQLWIKRDDLIHPVISGNKYRKLAFLHPLFRSGACPGVISYGGPFSNHIHALAWLCKEYNVPLTAFIRSHREYLQSPTMEDVREWGATIIPLSARDYSKEVAQARTLKSKDQFPGQLIIPEGGSHPDALAGIGDMIDEIMTQLPAWDMIVCPVGTGATLAGIVRYKNHDQVAVGVSALKSSRTKEIMGLQWNLAQYRHWTIADQWHFGGYGKITEELSGFLEFFREKHGIKMDPLYNGKALYALYQYVKFDLIPPGSKVVLVHTGGLQGART